MVIRVFVFLLLGFAIISYLIPVENTDKKDGIEEVALLTFSDSTMYTLSTDSMNRIVYSKEAMRYKTKDVMYEGALTLKGKDKENKEITDILYSDVIVKRGEKFKFINNVKYKRDNYMTLNTNELLYNAKTKVATNSLPFDGTYYNNYIKGENIYLDLINYHMKSKKTHFEIEVEQK